MASVLSPVYIAEISPAQIRGKLVCLNELTIVLGILTAQIVNWLIAEPIPATATLGDLQDTWNALYGWRRMFEAAVVPAVVFFIGLMFIPETPRWLAKRARWDRAHAVLASLGGSEYAAEVVSQMRSAFEEVAGNVAHTSRLTTRIRPVLIVGVTLAVLQQWCGINVIFNYAQEVFSAAGYALSGILFNIVITGLTMCVFTFVAIATVERLGRRALMLFGCGSLSIIYVLIGYCYHIHQGGVLLLGLIVAGYWIANWPKSREAVSFDGVLRMFLLAVLANVCYCAAYAVDLFVQYSGLRATWARRRWLLLMVGILFAAVIAHFFSMGVFPEPGAG